MSRGRKEIDWSPWVDVVSGKLPGFQVSEAEIRESIGKGRIPDPNRQVIKVARMEKLIRDAETAKAKLPGEYRKLAIISDSRYETIREENRSTRESDPVKKMDRVKNFLKGLDAESLSALLAELGE